MNAQAKKIAFTVSIPYSEENLLYACLLNEVRSNGSILEILWTGICSDDMEDVVLDLSNTNAVNSPTFSISCQISNSSSNDNGYKPSVLKKMIAEILPSMTSAQRGHLFCVGVDAFGGVDKVYSLINAQKPTDNELPVGVRIINGDTKRNTHQSVSSTDHSVNIAESGSLDNPACHVDESSHVATESQSVVQQPTLSSTNAIIDIDYGISQSNHEVTEIHPNEHVADQPVQQIPEPINQHHDINQNTGSSNEVSEPIDTTQTDKPHINLGNTQNTPNISGNIDFNEHAGQSGSREPISFLKGKFPI